MTKPSPPGAAPWATCVRAGALERLGGFAQALVLNTRDPRLLSGVVLELQSVAERVPEGKPRWSLRSTIADGLLQAGRPDEALPFYEQAAAEAGAAGHWKDLAWITQNRANALRDAGQLDAAKGQYQASAEAKRKAGSPWIKILGSELETLRTRVMQGQAEQARDRPRPEAGPGLAALCYDLIGGYGDSLRGDTRNLTNDMADAQKQGKPYPLPSLQALLAEPKFDPLRRFLNERAVDIPDPQRALDEILSTLAENP